MLNITFIVNIKCQFLLPQASELSITMATLYSQSVIQLEEVTLYQTAALNTLTNTLSANATVQEYLDTMRGWNQSATSYLYDALARRDEVVGLTVDGQAAMIETELERSRNVSLEADALLSLVMTQVSQSQFVVIQISYKPLRTPSITNNSKSLYDPRNTTAYSNQPASIKTSGMF